MKKTYRLYPFAFFDRDGITARLEGMARKGWLLECATPLWIYRRAEPAEVRYAVCYTPQVSENDPEPPEGQQEFREFCAHTGWEYVCSGAQMQIFRNFQEDPTPIETDPRLEVASIHASYRKQRLGLHLLQILLALRSLDLLFSQPRSPLARPGSLLSCVFWLAVLFLNAGQFLLYWAWRRRALAIAEAGVFLSTPPYGRPLRLLNQNLLPFALLYILLSLAQLAHYRLLTTLLLALGLLVLLAAILFLFHFCRTHGASRLFTRNAVLTAFAVAVVLLAWYVYCFPT